MNNTKTLNFDYQLTEDIKLEVSAHCLDNRIPVTEISEDNPNHYEVDLKTCFYCGVNVLPLLEKLKADKDVWDESYKRCFGLFNEL